MTATQAISLYLISEKAAGHSSFWWPYIETLPQCYTNAACWTDEDISKLPQRLRLSFTKQRQLLDKSYQDVVPFVSDNKDSLPSLFRFFSFDSYRWAWSAINTRTVYMKQEKCDFLNDEEEDHFALIPFLDLLNHTTEAEVDLGIIYVNYVMNYKIEHFISPYKYVHIERYDNLFPIQIIF